MEELKVNFSEYSPDLISFIANFYQDKYIFLENKNFKKEQIKITFNQLYIYLDNSYLDLKQFNMEISK